MLLPLLMMLSSGAGAASELIVKARTPVLIYVDGRQAGLTGKLQMRATDLSPGKVNIRVASMFGKTLYQEQWELEDWTVHQAEWRGKTLALISTTRIPGAPPPVDADPPAADAPIAAAMPEPEPEPTPAPQPPPTPELPLAVAAEPQAEAQAPQAEPSPASEPLLAGPAAGVGFTPEGLTPPPPTDATLSAAPKPAAPAAAAPAPAAVPPPTPRPVTIRATEGTRIEVVHQDTSVMVQVEDGVLSVVDDAGMSIAFGGVAAPSEPVGPPPAQLEVVSRDGHPATVIVDDTIMATIDPGEFRESLQLPPGNYLIELRDPETGRRMHRGIVTVESGDELEIGYSAVEAPRIAERPEAWKPL